MLGGALVLSVLIGFAACGWGGATAVDAQLHDFITRRLPSAAPSVKDVVIIDIDEPSLAQIGPWPWPRSVLADMVKNLRKGGAAVQAWDLSSASLAPSSTSLARSLTSLAPSLTSLDPSLASLRSEEHTSELQSHA